MRLLRIPLAWFYWLVNHNDKLAQERTAICVKCEYLIKGTCQLCGCPIIAKSRLSDEHCPDPIGDKWKSPPVSQTEGGLKIIR